MLVNLLALALIVGAAQGNIQTRCVQRGMYAMTWDDGPAQYTEQLLNTLNSKNVKATFHITTKHLTDPNIQSIIQRIAGSGHLIGLRTEAEWDLFKMSDDQIRAGLARQANVLAAFVGYVPKFVRLPYNKYDDRVLRAVESTGLVASSFNVETYDYTGSPDRIVKSIQLALSLVGKGAGSFISIQHDGVQPSVGATGKIIDLVKGYGYKFVKLDECLGLGDMSKNKEALKGGDDSLDLGAMGDDMGGMVGSGMGGSPMDAGSDLLDGDSALAGQGAVKKNDAVSAASSSIGAIAIALLALLAI